MAVEVLAKEVDSGLVTPDLVLWRHVVNLREYVDAWDFKQFVFSLLVYKYMSDSQCDYANELADVSNNTKFDFASLKDDEALKWRRKILNRRGYYIPPSELFGNVCRTHKGNANLDVKLTEILDNIESSSRKSAGERQIDGLFEYVNLNSILLAETSAKRSQKIEQLMNTISDITSSPENRNDKTIYGEIFEGFMARCGNSSGWYGEMYSTPPQLAELLVQIASNGNDNLERVYDPACGSGSILTKFAKVFKSKGHHSRVFGQEIDKSTYNLCRMNLLLHGLENDHIDIELGNTLLNPQFRNSQEFDAIASNLPMSITWNGDNRSLQDDSRFSPAGVLAPKSRANLAFVMHTVSMLSDRGTAAVSIIPAVLWQGRSERQIRKYLIDNNYIDGVIQLPKTFWYNGRIPICVLVLKKNRNGSKVVFFDTSSDLDRMSEKCQSRSESVNAIVDDYSNSKPREGRIERVGCSVIAENLYDLVPSSYLNKQKCQNSINTETIRGDLRRFQNDREKYEISLEKKIDDIKSLLHDC